MKIVHDQVYTTKEVAKYLKISPPTAQRMCKEGILRAGDIGTGRNKSYRILGVNILALFESERTL